jgi:hypothetical protein
MGKGVMTNRTCNGPRKNKANLGEVPSVKCQVGQAGRQVPGVFLLQTSRFTLQTRPKAVRAKQTQFPATPGGRGSGGWGRGPIVRNKANSTIADFGLRIGDRAQPCGWPPDHGQLYKQTQLAGANRAKQSQFSPRRQDRQRFGGKGLMVNRTVYRPRQNKANAGEV